jgi:hypothetical protein
MKHDNIQGNKTPAMPGWLNKYFPSNARNTFFVPPNPPQKQAVRDSNPVAIVALRWY